MEPMKKLWPRAAGATPSLGTGTAHSTGGRKPQPRSVRFPLVLAIIEYCESASRRILNIVVPAKDRAAEYMFLCGTVRSRQLA